MKSMRAVVARRFLQRRRRHGVALVIVVTAALARAQETPPAWADISYIYDAAGRLVGVVDPAADAVRYTYDSVGNLLSITRQPSTAISIVEFNPSSGSTGAVVTIWGTGFDPAPANNMVQFNGEAATITAATPTELIVTVPAGATSGPIRVTSPAGVATSNRPFTVAPVSSGLAPDDPAPAETSTPHSAPAIEPRLALFPLS